MRYLLALAAFALAATTTPVFAAGKHLALTSYLDFERVSDPQISPDGKQVIYRREWVDKQTDKWESALWVVNVDGSKNRYLTKGNSPRWSPDGARIAYLAEGEPKGEQIYVRYMDAEGATTQVTRIERAPRSIEWSPDGESIAFVSTVPEKVAWKVDLPSAPEGAKWTEAPRIVERLDYRQDRIGFTEDGYQHLFLVPATGGTPRQLTDGDYDDGRNAPISWTPDGQEILFTGLRQPDWEYAWRETEIYAVRVEDGSVRQVTDHHGPDSAPSVSPDGASVAYVGFDWTDDTFINSKLYVSGIDGKGARALTASLDRTPGDLAWDPDGRGVYFNVAEEGTSNWYFASLDGAARKVTQGNHIFDVTSLSTTGMAVGTITGPHHPPDVYVLDVQRPEPRQITFVNDDILHGVELGRVEEISYRSVDGLSIQGWLIYPPDFQSGKKYPLMLSIHGGPHGMYGVGFNFGWQEHAANGYLVLYTNPRGSSGYTSEFGNAIKNAYPSKDFDDLMAGVDEVIGLGIVDERNLFVYGCSGGGVLTAWVVGHTNRFAAASSNCPVTNWMSFVGTTDSPNWYRNFAKPFWEDPSEYLQRSPLMYVGNVETPTMLMTGVQDLRTPIPQTEEYYQALKMRKVPTAMVRFNEEFHGTTSRPSNFMRTQLYLRYWFEKHGTKADAPVTTSAISKKN
ncbi:MAG TPA: S9 family peptidase [Vicinamibacteria bacterium]|nr:S9 family peptidase [Vicinamibacteria bacterium]